MVTSWMKKRWVRELFLAAVLLAVAYAAVAAFTWWVATTFLIPILDVLTVFAETTCGS